MKFPKWLGLMGSASLFLLITLIISCNDLAILLRTDQEVVVVTAASTTPFECTISVGATIQLYVNFTPEEATDQTVEWTSSDETVASVDIDGLVTAVKVGTAVITATTNDGDFTDTTAVNVVSATIPVTGVTLTPDSVNLATGMTVQLTTTISPSNATNNSVNYSSSSTSIATVSEEGLVTATGTGDAVITVTTADGDYTDASTIIVSATEVNVTGVTLSSHSETLEVDDSVQLSATVLPSDATDLTVSWESSNSEVATVSGNGYVTATGIGTATISVTTNDQNKTDTATITVEETPVTGVVLSVENVSLEVGETFLLTPTVSPSDATDSSVSWSSSATSVATVSGSGLISAIAIGTAVIQVTTADGEYTATADIEVTAQTTTSSNYSVTLDFTGPDVSPDTTYACWIEDASGNNLKNFYICTRVAIDNLTGIPLPYWSTVKKPLNSDLVGVTGASVQGEVGLNLTRSIDFGTTTQIRVYFEIDRSNNSNDYFYDRPCFIYRTELITLSDINSEYDLSLYAWMSNATTGTTYGQQPRTGVTITGFEQYKLMEDLSYIADSEGSWDDMILSTAPVSVTITTD